MGWRDTPIDETTGGGSPLHGITRRQLLRLAPLLAAPAALGAVAPASARPIPPDWDPDAPPPPPEVAAPQDIGDMPMRSAARATRDCETRRRQAARELSEDATELGRVLASTRLWESRLGLANWMLLDEWEDRDLGNFTFPISPYTVMADDGDSRFLLLSNGNAVGDFRKDEYLERTHRRIFDRSIWAISNGATVTASVEFDRPLSPEKGARIFRLLAGHGVSTVIWGNEPNDPYTPWRDDLPNIFEILTLSNEVRKQYGLEDTDLSLPGLAYYGNGEYLESMLRTVKELQSQRGSGDPARNLPVQRVTDHFYGPVDQFLPRIRQMRDIMSREGVGHLKYDLTEIGNPTMANSHPAGDERLAECFFPQVASLAITSGLVDRIYLYSLLGSTWEDSLVEIRDGRLHVRPSYRSFILLAKLLARIEGIGIVEDGEMVHVAGSRSDGIGFSVVWSRVEGRNLTIPVPRGARVFTSLGDEVTEEDGTRITLWPKNHPSLAGPARIVISRRW